MIAVIGGTGFVGRNVVEQLSTRDEPVRVFYRSEAKAKLLKQFKNVELVKGDLLEPATLPRLLQGADKLIFTAAITANVKNTDNLYQRVHINGTRNAVKAAQAAGIKQIVLQSGLGTKPDKPGTYMQTRWEMEEIIRQSGIDWFILQTSILFGRGSEFFEAQARIIRMAPFAPVIGDGNTRFQPIYVKDVARCLVEALDRSDKNKRSLPLGGPEFYSYRQLINLMVSTLGKQRVKIYLPLWAARIQAQLFNLLPKPPLTPATLELFGFDNVTLDPQIVEHEFGFKPLDLKTYLKENGIG
ncbi:MAG: NAD(P)H-binding protein [Chloroflexota bacterium]|nr:NAD(P)H-binding protein [Chloroflexota bacterium]